MQMILIPSDPDLPMAVVATEPGDGLDDLDALIGASRITHVDAILPRYLTVKMSLIVSANDTEPDDHIDIRDLRTRTLSVRFNKRASRLCQWGRIINGDALLVKADGPSGTVRFNSLHQPGMLLTHLRSVIGVESDSQMMLPMAA